MSSEKKDAFNDIDFEKVEILYEQTPHDIREKCHRLCAEYIGGVWREISADKCDITRVYGGGHNQLYRCANRLEAIDGEPTDVAVRIYGNKSMDMRSMENDRINDIIIALIVSDKQLGPKIYGIFESGEIQDYYVHRHFRVEEQKNPILVEKVAQKLARLHSLNVPISKNSTNWSIRTIETNIESAYINFAIEELAKQYCESLLTINIRDEISWLKRCCDAIGSPIVFCHNDFRGNNIMISDSDINQNLRCEPGITFCDFEYSGYGYRGTDFGTIFGEWGRDLNGYKTLHNFPDDRTVKPFIDSYIEESAKIFGNSYPKNNVNSCEQILSELKLFTLVSNMFMCAVCLSMEASKSIKEFTKEFLMMGANIHIQNYLHLKKRFIEENAIPNDT